MYSVKFWKDKEPESENWDLQATEPTGNLPSSSALLVAHSTSVTFGSIYAVPLKAVEAYDRVISRVWGICRY